MLKCSSIRVEPSLAVRNFVFFSCNQTQTRTIRASEQHWRRSTCRLYIIITLYLHPNSILDNQLTKRVKRSRKYTVLADDRVDPRQPFFLGGRKVTSLGIPRNVRRKYASPHQIVLISFRRTIRPFATQNFTLSYTIF